ncbi:MAG: hypothetical protein LBD29_02285 [Treponema sp.]|jgi:heptaprenyl diphosphate synthase|nr:hypothetical protein [Treponema sp.]
MKAPAFYRQFFSSQDLFIAGMIMTVAFLSNPSTLFRTIQFLIFWAYALFLGKKNNPFITLLVMSGIIFFNLLVPYGKVLTEFAGFPITQGSLLGGLRRGVTLEGLIMLSKASIRPDLRLPGTFGSLLGESLRIFQRILDRKGLISRKRIIEGIDDLMLELSAEQESQKPLETTPDIDLSKRPLGRLILGGIILLIVGITGIALFPFF